MCTQHPIEEPCKLDPPWDGPQVIPAQLRRVDNLIFRRLNQFSRANGVEQTTPMHGWIIEYLYRHRDEPVFQRDIEREFSITRSTVTNILQLMERKGYIQRLSVPQDARLKQRANDLFTLLMHTMERISKRLANQREELAACAAKEDLKRKGDLLSASLYQLQKGDAVARVQNFYDPACPTVEIPLDVR